MKKELVASKKLAISQSNYIPWKGYFDMINMVDEFVFYDDVQYTNQDWRNRNKIKTQNGPEWLTIPVGKDINRLINEVQIKDHSWQKKHWGKILHNYRMAPYFKEYKELFEEIYLNTIWTNLSELNQHIIKKISIDIFGITTKFTDSRSFNLSGKKEKRYIPLIKLLGATEYISGPSAKDYLTEEMLEKDAVKLIWLDYTNYSEYNQKFPPFKHDVSILDLIFNEGHNAKEYMMSFKSKSPEVIRKGKNDFTI